MIEAFFAATGAGLVVAALLCRDVSRSLFLLFLGSLTLALDIALLAGVISGVIVASLYAGALVAMILVWLMLVEKEKVRVDLVYAASVLGSLVSGLVLYYVLAFKGVLATRFLERPIVLEDVLSIVLALMVASIGVVHMLGGERLWTR